jgi:hypothetical protein
MKELMERFYDSIRTEMAPPIPYREILLTARMMDEIFAQIYPSKTQSSRVKGQQKVAHGAASTLSPPLTVNR